ncbi:hypothetical protein LZ30DRAFT_297030 [Colletotrichum cereale]|nr:hypothetical protein LZ30DRAFT_297030 [Colletotrichum cereale]
MPEVDHGSLLSSPISPKEYIQPTMHTSAGSSSTRRPSPSGAPTGLSPSRTRPCPCSPPPACPQHVAHQELHKDRVQVVVLVVAGSLLPVVERGRVPRQPNFHLRHLGGQGGDPHRVEDVHPVDHRRVLALRQLRVVVQSSGQGFTSSLTQPSTISPMERIKILYPLEPCITAISSSHSTPSAATSPCTPWSSC